MVHHHKFFTIDDIKSDMVQNRGLFNGEFEWSTDNAKWELNTLQINSIGQVIILRQVGQFPTIAENSPLKLNNANIYNLNEIHHNNSTLGRPNYLKNSPTTPNFPTRGLFNNEMFKDIIIKTLHSSSVTFLNTNSVPVLQVMSINKEKIYFRSPNNTKRPFIAFLASLMVWQNMNIYGIHNKYFDIPLPFASLNNPAYKSLEPAADSRTNSLNQSIQLNDDDDDENIIIVNKVEKNLLVCRFKIFGPIPRTQKRNLEINGPECPLYPSNSKDINEGWFWSMGVLKSNGALDLLSEYDGTLLYSLNISCLIRSEIRQVHHSIFENSNILFVGLIEEMRQKNLNANVCPSNQKSIFFIPSPSTKFNELKNFPQQRILIDFPLHIDLEDWYVALKSLAAREYVGINAQYSVRSSLRISKKLNVDILEAKFNVGICDSDDETISESGEAVRNARLYSDIIFWDSVWARTSIVETAGSPFWREEFEFDLPILTDSFQILVKKCVPKKVPNKKNKKAGAPAPSPSKPAGTVTEKQYSDSDFILGVVSINEEIIENSNSKETWVPIYYPETGEQIGQICLRLSLKEWHILPPSNFEGLQKMLVNTSLNDFINFLNSNEYSSKYEGLEEVSTMMLDIFQGLHKEELWFSELVDFELQKVGGMFKNNGGSSNFFNTLFRGNSILTKTFEKYNLRVGQEFLQKVVGEFVIQVAEENLECEIDPARIKAPTSEEKEFIIDSNFMRLFDYVEKIWSKIYNSCNDLPQPIRKEFEILRTKLEKACTESSESENTGLPLNCVTGFLFLRLICPAILNPKLFFLIKDHQTGNIRRTLTLVSKILITMSSRSRFGVKEPWLIKMNYFLEQHESELLDYLDIITNRKEDPRPKILDLSDTVVRPDISISTQISEELPTNPFLIDKYLRLTQLANLMASELTGQQDEFNFFETTVNTGIPGSTGIAYGDNNGNANAIVSVSANTTGNTSNIQSITAHINKRSSFRNSYKVGSTEFEELVMKNNNLAFASEELLRDISSLNTGKNKTISSNLTLNKQVSLNDIKQESYLLIKKVNSLDYLLTSFENPSLVYANWGRFVNSLCETSIVDHMKRLLYIPNDTVLVSNPNYKKLADDGIAFLRLRFNDDAEDGFSTPKLSKLIKSASSNTLMGPRSSSDETPPRMAAQENGNKSPFRKTFFWRKK